MISISTVLSKLLTGFEIAERPEVGTLAALKSAAEAHYRISVLGWALREQAAARSEGDDHQPPPALRRQYWTLAYDRILDDLKGGGRENGYAPSLEILKAEVLAANSD
jgi:hypothetical protein